MNPWETFRSVVRFRRFETDPVARRLRSAITVDDMRRVARRRLPRGVFDYIDGAAEDERSMANNAAVRSKMRLRARNTTILRASARMPSSPASCA